MHTYIEGMSDAEAIKELAKLGIKWEQTKPPTEVIPAADKLFRPDGTTM